MTAAKQSQDPGSAWKRSSNLHDLPMPNIQEKTPDDGQRKCPKHVEFYNRINLNNRCIWLVTKEIYFFVLPSHSM